MKILKYLIIFISLFLCIVKSSLAQTPPPNCTITGLIINPNSNQPYIRDYIYFNSITLPLQTISGTVIYPLQFTARTDDTGFINPPLNLPQGLKVCITIGGPSYPGTLVQVPNTSTVDFATLLTTDALVVTPNPCTINSNIIVSPIFVP